MSAFLQFATVVALILGLLGVMAGLSHIARKHAWHPEVARKIVHVAASGIAIPLPWVFPDAWPVWLLLGLSLAAMLAMRTPLLAGPGRALHSVERRSWGDVLLVISVGLVLLLHRGEPVLYILPLLVLALGDAAAALTGSTYGRTFYLTEDGRKSVEGSTMLFLVTLILAMACLLLLTEIGRGPLIVVAVAIAVFATVIEADSWRGFDNLFLPMGVFLFLSNIVGVSGDTSQPRMALPLLAMVLSYGISRMAGMNPQVSRIHAVALFLILSATNFWNAILPAGVLVVHAIVSARRQERLLASDTLNVVSGLALVSFGFLALGTASGASAINFYGLVCGTIAAAHAARGLPRMAKAPGILAALAVAAAIWAVWLFVTGHNSAATHWHGQIGIPAAAAIATAALAPVLGPRMFQGFAGLSATLLGAVPALVLYALTFFLAGSGGG
ncbi:MAG: hypothetical protein IPF96_01275 [Rhodobacter sp.]|nr:hypothetical protein [Rhodobacter sp.]